MLLHYWMLCPVTTMAQLPWLSRQEQFIDAWHQIWRLSEIYCWMKSVRVCVFALYALYFSTEEALSSWNCLDHRKGMMGSKTRFVYCTVVWWILLYMQESMYELWIFIARRHGLVIRMASHNEGDWWMDTSNHEPVRASDYMYPYTNPRVV